MPESTENTETVEISAEAIASIHAALQDIPEAERAYVTRFVAGRVDREIDEVLTEFAREWGDRSEAQKIEEHRKTKVRGEFLETVPADKRDAIAKILGVGATATEGDPAADVKAEL